MGIRNALLQVRARVLGIETSYAKCPYCDGKVRVELSKIDGEKPKVEVEIEVLP